MVGGEGGAGGMSPRTINQGGRDFEERRVATRNVEPQNLACPDLSARREPNPVGAGLVANPLGVCEGAGGEGGGDAGWHTRG